MSAFYGTELDLQLRRRGCDTVVICGVATNLGVEATATRPLRPELPRRDRRGRLRQRRARSARLRGADILPRIARVRQTTDILAAIRTPFPADSALPKGTAEAERTSTTETP